MALPKLEKRSFFGGGVKTVLDDLCLEFSGELLDEILKRYNEGYSIYEIAEYTNRDPDEVFLAIFDRARKGYKVRKLKIRLK